MLYAVCESLAAEQILDITHEAICAVLTEEIKENKAFYSKFMQNDSDVEHDINTYIVEKQYDNDCGDLILAALCNALGMSAIIYHHSQSGITVNAHVPRHGSQSQGDIQLALCGANASAHYNWARTIRRYSDNTDIRVSCVEMNNTPNSDDSSFSPQSIRPHPQAPPRKATPGHRKRKSAVLTDTPEKCALEAEQMALIQKKLKKQTTVLKTPKRKKVLGLLKKTPLRKSSKPRKVAESEDEEDEECFCLVCVESYSNSKHREKWIQCYYCKGWAHVECTGVARSGAYVCQNCESDDDIEC